MKLLIIQTSPNHTASTLLINSIYGLIPELTNKNIIGEWTNDFHKLFTDVAVVKCHILNIDELIKKYTEKYKNTYKDLNILFICSERIEKKYIINDKYKTYKNVVVFDFNELNETPKNTLDNIVDNLHTKISILFDNNSITTVELNKDTCKERIINMNKRYEEIKCKPFSYIDPFYEIHGSHRNRKNAC